MLKLHTAPTLFPVTLAEARLHLRVDADHTAEDTLIQLFIESATADAEQVMRRAIMPQKWQTTFDQFESPLNLRRPTVTAVDSVKYIEPVAGVLTTLDPSTYRVILSEYNTCVYPNWNTSWPTARLTEDAVTVVFSTGYANAAAVPASIKAWVLLRVATLFENRESETAGNAPFFGLSVTDRLLDRYRNF